MAQVKIYGLSNALAPIRTELSDVIHSCVRDAFGLPEDKRFHRFIALADADFIYPSDRSERYTIVEFTIFEGRSEESRKRLIRLLYERTAQRLELAPEDLEISILEIPRGNWGIRGKPGDELELSYDVDV